MSDAHDANTAPADSTKPMACGACGEVDGLSLRVMTGPGRVKVACPCGAEGPYVTTAEAPGDFMAMQSLAFARWNAMWTPRAGEATDGVALIAKERRRQVEVEGWDADHDSGHSVADLANAASAYCNSNPFLWPWSRDSYKPKDRLANLVRAGALTAAAIDLLLAQRAEAQRLAGAIKSHRSAMSPPSNSGSAAIAELGLAAGREEGRG